MSENRRRRIIKTTDPFETEEDRELYEEAQEPLLERKVYVPVSLIFGGFFAIILMSFSLTYMVVTWGGDTLELAENSKLAAFREAAAETTLEFRQSPSVRPIGARRPAAEVDVGGYRSAPPGASIIGAQTPERRFDRLATARTLPPVVDLSRGVPARTPVAAINSTAIPGARRQATSFEKAAVIPPPTVDLTPGSFSKSFESVSIPQTSQKLMMRRFAKATASPEAATGNNPLTIPLEGGRLTESPRNFSRALGLNDPATDLILTAGKLPEIVTPTEVPGQKLMSRRFAKATVVPELLSLPSPGKITPNPDAGFSTGQDLEPWQRFAARVPPGIEGQGRIVIIIDDMGNNSAMARRLAELEGPLNFAFLPYAPNLARQTSNMRRAGHELLVHMPMEPTGNEYPGPRALTTLLNDAELLETLEWNLSRFEGFVGVNNHMGSRFTADRRRMDIVMKSLKERGLLFLDSVTTNSSKGPSLARSYDIPWAGRDIFIDNEVDEGAILAQLRKVEQVANHRGFVIAIGHPHGETYRALKAWIPTLKAKGLVLVPLSSVVRTSEPRKLAGGGQN